jgi:hypothetical protein
VHLSGEGETGSSVHRVKTRVQDDVIKFLLANLPNLTDLSLDYPAPGETMLDVAFSKLQHLSVAPQYTGWDSGYKTHRYSGSRAFPPSTNAYQLLRLRAILQKAGVFHDSATGQQFAC